MAGLPSTYGLNDDTTGTGLRGPLRRFVAIPADVVLRPAAQRELTVGPDDAQVGVHVLEHDVAQTTQNGVLLSLFGSQRVGEHRRAV